VTWRGTETFRGLLRIKVVTTAQQQLVEAVRQGRGTSVVEIRHVWT
jgi:hypothetical protein